MRTVSRVPSRLSKRRRAARPARTLGSELLEERVLLAQTTGVFLHDPGTSDGFVLVSPNSDQETRLIDKDGNVVNEWNFGTTPGLLAYLQEDGSLIRASSAASGGNGGNGVINAAGAGGRIEWVDWNGDPIWSFDYGIADTATDTRNVLQHHDIEVLPNGNILMIAWEYKTAAEAIQAGRNPATVGTELFPDHIVEVQPDLIGGGGTIVWEWHIWDHLIQDFDNTKDNFGVVEDHPEKIDINYTSIGDEGAGAADDWTHSNGIDYNAELDQIVLSVREFSEFWVIDHDTTTAEAAGPAGDLLYRWGNPETYGRGNASDRILYYQHDAKWVTDGAPGAGNITVFNNGWGGPANPDVSSVLEITTPVDGFGDYPALGPLDTHGPAAATWTYTLAEADFSHIISGTERLDNGNTLITSGIDGTLIEVTSAGTEVWRYVNPYVGDLFAAGGMLGPEDPIPPFPALGLSSNFVFRSIHYPVEFAPQLSSTVISRQIYYNNSGYDGGTPGVVSAAQEDSAIASDKSAYLPGSGTSSDANATNYSKGINGIMIDLASNHGPLTAADFEFAMSPQYTFDANTPSTWAAAPTPTVTVISDAPVPGVDRVFLTWPDGSIVNRHLEVTVKGDDAVGGNNTNTGLAASDIFYFTNQVGDTFDSFPGFFNTDASDEIGARNNAGIALLPTNTYDFNKDFFVDASDQILARNNAAFMATMTISNPPAPPDGDDGSGSAIASALAGEFASTESNVASAVVIDLPITAPAATSAPGQRFWHQLGAASDPRASLLLATLDASDDDIDLEEWLTSKKRT